MADSGKLIRRYGGLSCGGRVNRMEKMSGLTSAAVMALEGFRMADKAQYSLNLISNMDCLESALC